VTRTRRRLELLSAAGRMGIMMAKRTLAGAMRSFDAARRALA